MLGASYGYKFHEASLQRFCPPCFEHALSSAASEQLILESRRRLEVAAAPVADILIIYDFISYWSLVNLSGFANLLVHNDAGLVHRVGPTCWKDDPQHDIFCVQRPTFRHCKWIRLPSRLSFDQSRIKLVSDCTEDGNAPLKPQNVGLPARSLPQQPSTWQAESMMLKSCKGLTNGALRRPQRPAAAPRPYHQLQAVAIRPRTCPERRPGSSLFNAKRWWVTGLIESLQAAVSHQHAGANSAWFSSHDHSIPYSSNLSEVSCDSPAQVEGERHDSSAS